MTISLKELLNETDYNSLPKEHQANLMILLERINKIRDKWGKPMSCTSGYRSKEHHIEIYQDLAKQRHQLFDLSKVPMGSQHLQGAAVDISDPDGQLYEWCQSNILILETIKLWCEEKDDQKRVHFQIFAPKSGKRFFHP